VGEVLPDTWHGDLICRFGLWDTEVVVANANADAASWWVVGNVLSCCEWVLEEVQT
jgi:hypothetical protein